MSLPLDGIRVLDLSRLLPGGFCSLLLADFGAEDPGPPPSRSRSAAMMPKAAISAPPPMSAICPPDWIGGPPRSPVSPSRPTRPR